MRPSPAPNPLLSLTGDGDIHHLSESDCRRAKDVHKRQLSEQEAQRSEVLVGHTDRFRKGATELRKSPKFQIFQK